MGDFLGNLAVAVLTATIAAILTVYLAMRRFRSDKWWERRIDAYAGIINALSDDRICSEKYMREYERQRQMDESERKKVQERDAAAYAVIQRAIDTGSFLLSDEANTALAKMQEETDKAGTADDFYDYVQTQHGIAKKYLKIFSEIARRDLRVK